LEIVVDLGDEHASALNSYSLDYVAEQLTEGSCEVDIRHVANARELLTDVAQWAGDDRARRLLADTHPLGRLLAELSRRSPRMAQSWHPSAWVPPREAIATEAAQFRDLVGELREGFRVHPDRWR
jgi:hypothetical protein